ncbi:MAG: signal peptidase I [Clostridia bacterium]|nr:signal peptidase I [Clostridia bacterium]
MKKTLNIIKNIFVWIVMLVAIFMMVFTIISVNTFNRDDRNLFGLRVYIVLSDSMSATDFAAGDLVFVHETDPEDLKAGDIIAFTSQNDENYGETVTHKIRSLTVTENGEPGFVTYGTTTDTDDEAIVTYPYILGKYSFSIPKLGSFFQFLKTTPGYIMCILVPFMILIIFQGINCVKIFKVYKAEQMSEIKAEREKLEAERLESQKMMAELLELKKQLAGNAPPTAEAPSEGPAQAPEADESADQEQ